MVSQHALMAGLEAVTSQRVLAPRQDIEVKRVDVGQPHGTGVGLMALTQKPLSLHTLTSLVMQGIPPKPNFSIQIQLQQCCA